MKNNFNKKVNFVYEMAQICWETNFLGGWGAKNIFVAVEEKFDGKKGMVGRKCKSGKIIYPCIEHKK